MIKKILVTLILFTGLNAISFAQKFAYVDTEYILNQVPEYRAAQAELDKLSTQWQKEIETKYSEIEKMHKAYQAEQILLTDELKKKREEDIQKKEKEAKELQKQKYGEGGELFKKRQELVKPIQDKVYTAIKQLAEQQNLGAIFDKASDLTMLYTNSKYDKSDDVLKIMGYGSGAKNNNTKKGK